MIGKLTGIIDEKRTTQLILDVNGVGYLINISLRSQERLGPVGSEATVYIHAVYREDAALLYGFDGREEKDVFLAIIKISGIGPRIALSILSRCSPAEFKKLIINADVDRLKKFEGIGKKTAEKLAFELKNAFPGGSTDDTLPHSDPQVSSISEEAALALVTLGYTDKRAREVICKIAAGKTGASVEELVKAALTQQ